MTYSAEMIKLIDDVKLMLNEMATLFRLLLFSKKKFFLVTVLISFLII